MFSVPNLGVTICQTRRPGALRQSRRPQLSRRPCLLFERPLFAPPNGSNAPKRCSNQLAGRQRPPKPFTPKAKKTPSPHKKKAK
jgi:hypothetical protein